MSCTGKGQSSSAVIKRPELWWLSWSGRTNRALLCGQHIRSICYSHWCVTVIGKNASNYDAGIILWGLFIWYYCIDNIRRQILDASLAKDLLTFWDVSESCLVTKKVIYITHEIQKPETDLQLVQNCFVYWVRWYPIYHIIWMLSRKYCFSRPFTQNT